MWYTIVVIINKILFFLSDSEYPYYFKRRNYLITKVTFRIAQFSGGNKYVAR